MSFGSSPGTGAQNRSGLVSRKPLRGSGTVRLELNSVHYVCYEVKMPVNQNTCVEG